MTQVLDFAGIGAGPFNLSIAALVDGLNIQNNRQIQSAFFEQKTKFSWHQGMQLEGVRLQTSYLKDLVTGVSPTNPYSFLNYLVQHKRFYQFLTAEFDSVSRYEYGDYLRWVSNRLPNVHFDSPVRDIEFTGEAFKIHFINNQPPTYAKNICVGTGKKPYIPECAQPFTGDKAFHAIGIANRPLNVSGLRVGIIGGGQTGAEIFERMLGHYWGEAKSVHFISRRPNLEPLDESPFTNELFTPQYVNEFFGLPKTIKSSVVHNQKLASDGISPSTLKAIYQRMYELFILNKAANIDLRPNRNLVGLKEINKHFKAEFKNALTEQYEQLDLDIVIFCTGFENSFPDCLDSLHNRIERDPQGHLDLARDFQVTWDGPDSNKIYAVNAGRHSHGIAEPQMSLMCWRSACIINSLLKEEIFDLNPPASMVNWMEETSEQDFGFAI